MKKILFVGQTPPPYGGQAIMIEKILEGHYKNVKLFHVRMVFSKEMDEIGKASFYKIMTLFQTIAKIVWLRISKNANILYYPPAGPDNVPVLRDIFILLSTRWLFKKTIFHFHAGGLSEFKSKNKFSKFLFRLAYYHADCAILLSSLNPQDGEKLKAKKQIIVPYGIEDHAQYFPVKFAESPIVTILFVAVIRESKGILVLLEAAKLLREQGVEFRIEVMGKFDSKPFEQVVRNLVDEYGLHGYVDFLGVLSGKEKFAVFSRVDIFCFPTFFESETFGVVLLEAMQFSLPLVATKWRGIPSLVADGKNGYLVEPKRSEQLADRLRVLANDQSLRQTMGRAGRDLFLKHYTLDKFHHRMEEVFRNC
jgi:glycosyltransferase involved in cell wall biosynthesis